MNQLIARVAYTIEMLRFFYLDYSEAYFVTLMQRELPAVRRGKFVQLRKDDEEYVVLSPKQLSTYHGNIVERFLLKLDVSGEWNRKRDAFTLYDRSWTIVGGGHFVIDDEQRTLDFSGVSQAYGPYDPQGLRERLAGAPKLKGYAITC